MGTQQRFFSGKRPFRPHADLSKHIRHTVTRIKIIIYYKRPTVFQFWNFRRQFIAVMQTKRKADRHFRPFPQHARYRDRTVHQIYDIFCNRHAKAGSLYPADRTVFLPLERFKNMSHKFFAHSKPRIAYRKLIIRTSAGRRLFFGNPHTDHTACACIFHRVPEQI